MELTATQKQNLLEFWQTAQIDNSLYNFKDII